MKLHPTIAEKYELAKNASNVVHISGLGVRDLSVTPLSVIKPFLDKMEGLTAIKATEKTNTNTVAKNSK